MKRNRILLCFVSLLLVLLTMTALASDVTETPIIRPEKSFLSATVTTNATGDAVLGDSIALTTTLTSSSADKKFASASVKLKVSDGLEIAGEPVFTTLSDSWSVKEYALADGVLSLKVATDKVEDAVSELKIELNLKATSTGEKSVTFDSVSATDKFNMYFIVVSKKATNNTFTVLGEKEEVLPPTLTNLGAALRINNTPALRFGMTVEKDEVYKSAFTGAFEYSAECDIKFGMLIIEKDRYLEPLTVNHADVTSKIFTEALSESDDAVTFALTLDEVNDYTKEYVFRPYAMVKDGAEYLYFYGEEKTRSAKGVAESAVAGETDQKKIELLNEFVK